MIVLWIHWVAAIAFIGGLIFHVAVFRPALRETNPKDGAGIIKRVEQRFKTVRWLSLLALLATGIINLLGESGSARIESAYGGVLMIKLFFVLVIFALTGVYDFALGGGASTASRGPVQEPVQSNAQAAKTWIGLTILFFGLATIFAAVFMARM